MVVGKRSGTSTIECYCKSNGQKPLTGFAKKFQRQRSTGS